MDADATPEVAETLAPVESPPSARSRERLAAWLQFPRRAVLLPAACGLAVFVIRLLRFPAGAARGLPTARGQVDAWTSVAIAPGKPVVEILVELLPATLLLWGAALALALLVGLMAALVAVLVHRLQAKVASVGSLLKIVGRLLTFGWAAAPPVCLALVLILLFAFRLRWLPGGGMLDPRGVGGAGDLLRHLALPAVTLGLLPATLAAQVTARYVTLARERGGSRVWWTGLLQALGTLLGQSGGLLGAATVIEAVFSWPGLGRVLVAATTRRDFPVLFGALMVLPVLTLAGRLLAELFHWLERLLRVPLLSPQPPLTRGKKARVVWWVLALLLLLVPLGLAVAGLTVSPQRALEVNAQDVLSPPSAEHPFGTDRLGRDVLARTLRGSLITLGMTALTAAIVLIPGVLWGSLTGWLASRRVWWAESIADVLLFPTDVLLLIPILPGSILLVALMRDGMGLADNALLVGSVAGSLLLLPRVVRMAQTLWLDAPARRKGLVLGLAGPAAVLLGASLAALWFVASLDVLGLGVPPPLPTLGGLLWDAFLALRPGVASNPLIAGVALWACAFVFYTATDALVGLFLGKGALARLNE